MKITDEELGAVKAYASEHLSQKRFMHTIGVETEAVFIAERLGLDEDRINELRAAALLHDITKEWSDEKQIAYCREKNVPLSFPDRADPTVHSRTGAYYAKELFPDIVNDTVFGAIYYHTTGKSGMTLEEKIICLSDFIEPGRRYESCISLRKRFHENISDGDVIENIDDCLLGSFDMTIISLINRGIPIDKDTFEARNYLIEKGATKRYE